MLEEEEDEEEECGCEEAEGFGLKRSAMEEDAGTAPDEEPL